MSAHGLHPNQNRKFSLESAITVASSNLKNISQKFTKIQINLKSRKKLAKLALTAILEIKARIKPVSSEREDNTCPEGNLTMDNQQ